MNENWKRYIIKFIIVSCPLCPFWQIRCNKLTIIIYKIDCCKILLRCSLRTSPNDIAVLGYLLNRLVYMFFMNHSTISNNSHTIHIFFLACEFSCQSFRQHPCKRSLPIYLHYDDVIMSEIASQITSLTIVYSTVHLGADQSKHQSSASLAFVWEIHRWPVNFPHKWPVTRKIFPFDDVIMFAVPTHCSPTKQTNIEQA